MEERWGRTPGDGDDDRWRAARAEGERGMGHSVQTRVSQASARAGGTLGDDDGLFCLQGTCYRSRRTPSKEQTM